MAQRGLLRRVASRGSAAKLRHHLDLPGRVVHDHEPLVGVHLAWRQRQGRHTIRDRAAHTHKRVVEPRIGLERHRVQHDTLRTLGVVACVEKQDRGLEHLRRRRCAGCREAVVVGHHHVRRDQRAGACVAAFLAILAGKHINSPDGLGRLAQRIAQRQLAHGLKRVATRDGGAGAAEAFIQQQNIFAVVLGGKAEGLSAGGLKTGRDAQTGDSHPERRQFPEHWSLLLSGLWR